MHFNWIHSFKSILSRNFFLGKHVMHFNWIHSFKGTMFSFSIKIVCSVDAHVMHFIWIHSFKGTTVYIVIFE